MILNEYELTYIAHPELPEDAMSRLLEKMNTTIKTYGGELLIHDPWGRRKLAYPIKKHNYGSYVYLNFVGPANLPHEMERLLRLDDQVIRFLTVRLGANITVEGVREAALLRHRSWVDSRNSQAAAAAEKAASSH